MTNKFIRKKVKKSKKVKKLIKNLIKPSKLPKGNPTSVRISPIIKKYIEDHYGQTLQQFLNDIIDEKFSTVEFEKKIKIETKK